jgi:hypothetical protein
LNNIVPQRRRSDRDGLVNGRAKTFEPLPLHLPALPVQRFEHRRIALCSGDGQINLELTAWPTEGTLAE